MFHVYCIVLTSILLFLSLSVLPALVIAAQQQRFRVQPRDLQVLEGSEALLRCEIQNLMGAVQWTKDGFALGKLCDQIEVSLHKNDLNSNSQGFPKRYRATRGTRCSVTGPRASTTCASRTPRSRTTPSTSARSGRPSSTRRSGPTRS